MKTIKKIFPAAFTVIFIAGMTLWNFQLPYQTL